MKKVLGISFLFFAFIALVSCQEDEDPQPTTGKIVFTFDHYFDNDELVIFDKKYATQNGDSINIEELKYIISNIRVLNPGAGISFREKDSYHLIKVPDEGFSDEIVINNVHAGTYNTLEFFVGLDSAMNFAPESAPKLFLDEGMFWEWNTGYKFFVLEGRYFPSPVIFSGLVLHIGDQANLAKFQWDLSGGQEIEVKVGKTTRVNITAQVAELFRNPKTINLGNSSYRDVMALPISGEYKTNYENGFWSLSSVENP